MKDSRIGEALWSEWTGESYSPLGFPKLIFFTEEHVDVHHELVRRALASAIQRDGSADSLGESFKLLDTSKSKLGYAGLVDGDLDYTECGSDGLTFLGDKVEKSFPVTWVEIYE
jgi:hypothetical protein